MKDRNKSSPAPSQLLLPTLPAPTGMSLLGRLSNTIGFNKVISCTTWLLVLCPGDCGPVPAPERGRTVVPVPLHIHPYPLWPKCRKGGFVEMFRV